MILSICQLHILLSRTAQIYLELHFCVELHTKKALHEWVGCDWCCQTDGNALVVYADYDTHGYTQLTLTCLWIRHSDRHADDLIMQKFTQLHSWAAWRMIACSLQVKTCRKILQPSHSVFKHIVWLHFSVVFISSVAKWQRAIVEMYFITFYTSKNRASFISYERYTISQKV